MDEKTKMPAGVLIEHIRCRALGEDSLVYTIGGREAETEKYSPTRKMTNNPRDLEM